MLAFGSNSSKPKTWKESMFQFKREAIKTLISQPKSVRQKVLSFTCRRVGLSVLFRPSTDGMKSTHLQRAICLLRLTVQTLISSKTPSQTQPESCVAKYLVPLGSVSWPIRGTYYSGASIRRHVASHHTQVIWLGPERRVSFYSSKNLNLPQGTTFPLLNRIPGVLGGPSTSQVSRPILLQPCSQLCLSYPIPFLLYSWPKM